MKVFCLLFVILTSCFGQGKILEKPNSVNSNPKTMSQFYKFKMTAIDGKTIDFSKYAGKKVLIVNTASECGYTAQYKELQKLHETYGDKVTVLGFPCNDFGGQEPGATATIQAFCEKNYGVTFQLFEKVTIKGNDTAPLYKWLSDKKQNGWNEQAPTWNFCKYLINEKGELVKFFPSAVNPMGKEIVEELEK